jgi:hypothetical protein
MLSQLKPASAVPARNVLIVSSYGAALCQTGQSDDACFRPGHKKDHLLGKTQLYEYIHTIPLFEIEGETKRYARSRGIENDTAASCIVYE